MKEEVTDTRTADERRHDGHNAMTTRWPLASGAKNNVKIIEKNKRKSLQFAYKISHIFDVIWYQCYMVPN